MAIRNYLIEGGSGTGKTTVAEELERRGYHVVHGDRALAFYGDPETGEPLDAPPLESKAERIAWGYAHWIWPEAKVRPLAADRQHAITFFCGHSSNHHRFIDLFDAVFVLDVDFDTLTRRLAGRPEDEFGGRPVERELVVRLHETKEDIPRDAILIDATAGVTEVVDAILNLCG